MKVKKIAMGVTAVLASSMLLVACGNNDSGSKDKSKSDSKQTATVSKDAKKDGTLTDGTYKLEEKNYDHGYRVSFDIKVKDGKITESNYDYLNKDGKKKSEDAGYEKAMKAKSGVGPKEYIKQLNDSLVKEQAASKVEAVSGATHSSDAFANYANQLIQAAQRGDTSTIEIDNGAKLKDGKYSLEEKNYAHNYRVVFNIEVKDGKIATSDYNYVTKDGKKKSEDADYEKAMKSKTGVGPKEYIPTLNKELEKKQSADVDTVSGATESSKAFQLYADQLINAAQKGDTKKIEVYNFVEAE